MNRKLIYIVLAFVLAGCATATPAPTAAPTNTPLPTPTSTPKPTDTPVPTPTLAPPFNARALDNLTQVDSVMIVSTTTMDITSGYKAGKSQEDSYIKYIREPAFYHYYGKASPFLGPPDDLDEMLGIQVGGDSIIELYVVDEQQVLSFGNMYQYSNMENVIALEMGDDYDIAASFDLEYVGLDTYEIYGFLRWLGPIRFNGLKTLNDTPCLNYIFDQNDIKSDMLPSGMNVTEANGNVCIAQTGSYLVHMDLKMIGENLFLGPPASVLIKTGKATPKVEAGSLETTLDVSQVNQLTVQEIPAELIDKVKPPKDIPIFEGFTPVVATTGWWNGFSYYSFVAETEPQVVIDYYKDEMSKLDWKFAGQKSVEGGVELTYKKEDRIFTIWIGTKSEQTLLVIQKMREQ